MKKPRKEPIDWRTPLMTACAILISLAAAAVSKGEAAATINRLDDELAKRQRYINARRHTVDSLSQWLDKAESHLGRMRIIHQLGQTYTSFDNDSALHIFTMGYNEATAAGDEPHAAYFRIKRATYLPLSGFISDAINEFEAVDYAALPDSLKAFYAESGRQMYSYISSFYDNYADTKNYWRQREISLRDTLLKIEPPNSPIYRLNYGGKLIEAANYSAARDLLTKLLDELTPESNLYARACHMLATIARAQDDVPTAEYYLALSAIADTRGAVLEVQALQELGVMMSEQGDINRAYNYLNAALSNAVDCNATMRIVQSSNSLPLIQTAHNKQVRMWENRMYAIIAVLIAAFVSLVVAMFFVRRQMRKTDLLKDRLQQANEVKELYISQFFQLCSIYIDRLNQFCKTANRKISSGQVDELYKMTKSGKLIEEQSQEFYKLFDDAFLHIYPTFVDDVNALLHDKITLKDGEKLNNDLRLLAFMRLGLEDTNQVALILNYSVNTIYAYRNKLRNRAYDRDNFEADVMRIGTI